MVFGVVERAWSSYRGFVRRFFLSLRMMFSRFWVYRPIIFFGKFCVGEGR